MVNFLLKSVVLALAIFIGGCTTQQAPARVVSVKPTIKRIPPKKVAKPEVATAYTKGTAGNIAASKNSSNKDTKKNITKKANGTTGKSNSDIQWSWPAKGSILTKFSAGQATFKGIDIAGSEGTPVLAASDGEVVYSGNSLRGYGNLIIIKHNKNFLTAYAHNRKNMVKEGDKVILGQRIAEMGQTGTDKVKLHFEVRYQGKPIDPQEVLPAR